MKIKKIFYTPRFKRRWRKLLSGIKKKAIRQEKLLRQDVFHPSLLTHKLTGKLSGYWSFSIDYRTRVIFRFLKEGEVLFVDVGTHEIYR